MKKYISVLAAAFMAAVACGPVSKEISISFDVENPVEKSVVLVYNGKIDAVELDGSGHGEIVLGNAEALYANLFYGMASKKVYFEAGDKVHISFDGGNYGGTFKFEGAKAPAVNYLNTVVPTGLSDEDYALDFDEYRAKLAAKEKETLQLLADTDLKGTGRFAEVEAGRIRYAFGASLMMYSIGHKVMTQNMDYEVPQAYYDAIAELAVDNELLADVEEYMEFMCEAAHILDRESDADAPLYEKLVNEMKYIVKHYDNVKVRESLLHHIASPYIENFGVKGVQNMENIYRTYVKNPVLTAEFQKNKDRWDYSIPGKRSPDFSAPDIDGKKHSLRDFRGNYVYIDMWATWCRPCRGELPYLKALEEKFAGRNIVFLGLSIDDDKAAWEQMVRSGELSGVQLYLGTGSSFQSLYGIDGIPRFILLDMEGKVINANMTRPSQKETEEFLNSLQGL